MFRSVIGAAALAFALLSSPPAWSQTASELAARDPALVEGVLANGLRYAILPNRTPRQQVSIRLHVAAGSGLETPAERGAAHFVEHMAFEGSRRFPGTSADARFAAAGISVGRDQNAFTDVSGVLYVFDIPQVDAGKLDLAFDWMRDVGDGLTFDPAAAVREREVVLQEIAVRRTGSTDLAEAVARFTLPELTAARLPPGGTPQSVKALDAAALKAFHDRWYRPERTTLVVAGDVDPQVMLARIQKAFGDWTPAGPAPAVPDPGRVDPARPLAAMAVNTPNFAQGLAQVCRVRPRDPPQAPGAAAWRRDGAEAMWLQAVQLRLRRLARAADAPFVSAQASRQDAYRRATLTCLAATPKSGRWSDSLRVLDEEARRVATHGLTAAEAARARADLQAAVETAASQGDTRASSNLAAALLAAELDERPFTTPAESARTFALAAPDLTPAAAAEAFRKVWTAPGGPALVVLSTTPIDVADVRKTWSAAEAAPAPAPPVDEAVQPWPYTDFGPPSSVVRREAVADPDFVRLEFANGLRVNFKQTTYAKNRVDLRISFGGGQQELRADQQAAAQAAVGTLSDGGLGRLDSEALGQALQGRIWNASLGIERTSFVLSGATRPADLLTELQVLGAYLTDPGFRPEVERRIPSLADAYDKSNHVEPIRAAQIALNASLPRPHVFDPPTREAYAALKAADLAGALRPAITQGALEVTIVGDVEEAAVVAALSRTLGALPRRDPASRIRPDAALTRFAATPPPLLRATHIGLRDKAAVLLAWPLYVWEPARQREARAITLLREVLAEALRQEIRERLGLTYTPVVGLSLDRGGDQGSLSVIVQTSPAQAEAAAIAVRGVTGRLARDGVTAAELERVRKPLLDETARRKESNGWWLGVLDGSWAYPYKLEQQRTWLRDYSTLTSTEVGAVARRWLSGPPLVAIATPDPNAPGGPPGASAPTPAAAPPPIPSPAVPAPPPSGARP